VKQYFITGILIWVPILITFLVLRVIFQLGDAFLLLVPKAYQPIAWLGFNVPGFGLVLVMLLLLITGLLFRNVFGDYLVKLSEHIAAKVPIVSSVHNGVRQALRMIFTTNKSFQEVVLVEYPRRDVWSVAFVTNRQAAHGVFDADTVTLFIPTTPNPTSGYVFIVEASQVKPLDMSVDEAVKFVISLGTVDGIGDRIQDTSKGDDAA
jgi:uncharacterized membrane protein